MIRFFLIRIVLPLLIVLFIRALFRSIVAGFRSAYSSPPPGGKPARPQAPAGGELKKDPVCGTYVSPAAGISRSVNGELVYFCSAECRDKYRVA